MGSVNCIISNFYTLETDSQNGQLKQHWTILSWRGSNLFASNSMIYRPDGNPSYSTVLNVNNSYVSITFNTAIQSSDLILGNFSKTFNANGGTATDVTLDSIVDGNGNPISTSTDSIRINFSVIGTIDGVESFTITASEVNDLFGGQSTSLTTASVNLQDSISALSNVIAYWREGSGDNSTGTATKTDVKNGRVLTASSFSNPTLSSNEWTFNGTNQGFSTTDSNILSLINADAKDFSIHFKGKYLNSSSSRIITATDSSEPTNSNWNFLYKTGAGDFLFNITDSGGSTVSKDSGVNATLSQDYIFSLKFYQNSGNKLDVYIYDGSTWQSDLNIDISTINTSSTDAFYVGARVLSSGISYYNVSMKSIVVADSESNFDTIRTQLQAIY